MSHTTGWTDVDEAAFAEIMRAGKINRLAAIRIYRRCRENIVKAVKVAKQQRYQREHPEHS